MDNPTKELHYPPMKVAHVKRPHGFPGQRMVIVPFPTLKRIQHHPLLKASMVTGAGFFPNAEGHSIVRPKGVASHLLIACLAGAGSVSTASREYQAKPGDIFWLPRDSPHCYESSPKNPWSILWVHFIGEEAPSWRNLVFDTDQSDACNVPVDQIGSLALDRIHNILENGYSLLNVVDATSALRFSLGMLARLKLQSGATPSARLRVSSSIEKLRSDWSHFHRIEELAIQAGVSVSHYSTLFKKETGFSPIDFLIRQRIQHAARLLATTQESIASVSASAGYEEPYYFSRSFRKIMGCSPRDYRAQSRS